MFFVVARPVRDLGERPGRRLCFLVVWSHISLARVGRAFFMNPAGVSLHNARKKHAAKTGAQYDQPSVRPGWERQSGCCVLVFFMNPAGVSLHNARKKHAAKKGAQYDQPSVLARGSWLGWLGWLLSHF